MRKVDDGGKKGKKEKRLMKIVATTSLLAVERRPLERRTLVPINNEYVPKENAKT